MPTKDISTYEHKRNFRLTDEPRGTVRRRRWQHSRDFMIHLHDARTLHYDLRLEHKGVLKCWAVPKGPSFDPSDKRLAVQTEDHPYDYASYEGVIPEGQYGAGPSLIWDAGRWRPLVDVDEGLKKGRLRFYLSGVKLKGIWNLIRFRTSKRHQSGIGPSSTGQSNKGQSGLRPDQWLLIKEEDKYSGTDYQPVNQWPESIATGRDLDDLLNDQLDDRSKDSKESKGQRTRDSENKQSSKNNDTQLSDLKKILPQEVTNKITSKQVDQSIAKKLKVGTYRPQLATLSSRQPQVGHWIFERKFDGYRMLVYKDGNDVSLMTRNNQDWTDRFPALVQSFRSIPVDAFVVDTELVHEDSQGKISFQELQNAMQEGRSKGQLKYYVFDLLNIGGYDLTRLSLRERMRILHTLWDHVEPLESIELSRPLDVKKGDDIREQSCRRGWEGVIAKKLNSPYRQKRSREWLKIKCSHREEFVVVGMTKPKGSREHFGSLLLATYQNGQLFYSGRVGTGFNQKSLSQVFRKLSSNRSQHPPDLTSPPNLTSKIRGLNAYANTSDKKARKGSSSVATTQHTVGAAVATTQRTVGQLTNVIKKIGQIPARDQIIWLKPKYLAEIVYTEKTKDFILRHPVFVGLREDKNAKDLQKESLTNSGEEISGQTSKETVIKLTNPDRVLYEKMQITKRDLIEYYEVVSERLFQFARHRLLAVVRCPRGVETKCFFQRHIDQVKKGIPPQIQVELESTKGSYSYLESFIDIKALVQLGSLELHCWNSRIENLNHPDFVVFDLDPAEDVGFSEVVHTAWLIRLLLSEIKHESFVRTTGGKGLHVLTPISGLNWDESKEFSKQIAGEVLKSQPDQFTLNLSKSKRKGKIFIDYLRNYHGATSIMNYSPRAKPGASVATPLFWDEVTENLDPKDLDLFAVENRIKNLREDPWEKLYAQISHQLEEL